MIVDSDPGKCLEQGGGDEAKHFSKSTYLVGKEKKAWEKKKLSRVPEKRGVGDPRRKKVNGARRAFRPYRVRNSSEGDKTKSY